MNVADHGYAGSHIYLERDRDSSGQRNCSTAPSGDAGIGNKGSTPFPREKVLLIQQWDDISTSQLAQQVEGTTGTPCAAVYWHQWQTELLSSISPDVVLVNVSGPLASRAELMDPLLSSDRRHFTLLFGGREQLEFCDNWKARADGWAAVAPARNSELLQGVVRALETTVRRRIGPSRFTRGVGLRFSEQLRMIFSPTNALPLTECETHIMALLLEAGSAGLSRSAALATLNHHNSNSRHFDVVISRLRRKLGTLSSVPLIFCMRGHGYRLAVGHVTAAHEAPGRPAAG